MRIIWSKGKITVDISVLYAAGERINSNHIQKNRPYLYAAAVKYFGGWKQAVEAAGFNYFLILVRKQRSWSQKKVVAAIRKRFRQKLPINGFAVSKDDKGVYLAAKRYFGQRGYDKALRVAGFDPRGLDPKLIWPEKRVVREILKLHRRGVPLNQFWLQKHYGKLLAAGRNRFGNWKYAIQAAGLDYTLITKQKMNWWTPRRVICQVKRLEKAGFRLNSKSIHHSRGDLFAAAILLFDSWSQAVEAAGIYYRLHSKRWSSKAFVRKLTKADVETIERSTQQLARKRRKEQKKCKQ